jgi:hypothetical protein
VTPYCRKRSVFRGYSVFPGGAATGWHHHGGYATYAQMTDGEMTIEFGPVSAESAVAPVGDAVFIPDHLVRRETVAAWVEPGSWCGWAALARRSTTWEVASAAGLYPILSRDDLRLVSLEGYGDPAELAG